MSKTNLLISLLVMVSLSSCRFYKSTSINAPILEEKGDLEVTTSFISSLDFKASYAITDHIAVIGAHGNNFTSTSTRDSVEVKSRNNRTDLGLGFYNTNKKVYYSTFFGYGLGHSSTPIDDLSEIDSIIFEIDFLDFGARFNGPFIQASTHIKSDNDLFLGLVARADYLTFSDFMNPEIYNLNGRNVAQQDNSFWVGQVGLDLNYRRERFGGGLQMSYTFHNSNAIYFTARRININLGFYARLGEILKN